MFLGIFSPVVRQIARRIRQLDLAMMHRSEALGLRVLVDRNIEDPTGVAARVSQAAAIVATIAPVEWSRAKRHLRAIVVEKLGRPGASFSAPVPVCVLDVEYARHWSLLDIAAAVVHEATHARIQHHLRLRTAQAPMAVRDRVERLALAAQLRFLERAALPPHARPEANALREHYAAAAQRPWYTDADHLAAELARVRAMELPPWLERWAERRVRRLIAKAARDAAV